jgi:hypothetical protein
MGLQLSCQLEKYETAPILNFFDVSMLQRVEGRLMGSLTVNGKLNNLSNLKCQGTINLDDWSLRLFHNLEISNLSTLATINDRRITFENITAESCDGTVSGSMWVQVPRNNAVLYGGKLVAEHIDLHQLTKGIPILPKINGGTGMAHYTFDMCGSEIGALRAYGLLMLDNAPLWNMPVALQLLTKFNINDPASPSDLAALFAMNGAVTTFHRAVLTNALSAIEMEPGGRINLKTTHVDLYVVGVPLKLLRKFISAIPVIKLLIPLRDRLSRLHLVGSWSGPPTALIFKAPVKKLEQNTETFMKTTVRTEGQVTDETLDVFKRMFEDLSQKKTTRPATR